MTDSTDDIEWWGGQYEAELEKARTTWTGKDGTNYKISEMATSHIKNCIAMLRRYHLKVEADLGDMLCSVNGEQATYALENALDELIEEGHNDIAQEYIGAFNDELERRGEKL